MKQQVIAAAAILVVLGGDIAHGQTASAPEKGANSFTQIQAADRIAAAGYVSVSGLTKDADGICRGRAMKNGSQVDVWVDYKGRVGQS